MVKQSERAGIFFKNKLTIAVGVLVVACSIVIYFRSYPETILFLGDSITEEGGFVREIEAALKHVSPEHSFRVINRGKNSETISGLTEAKFPGERPHVLTRLSEEMSRFRPDWVVSFYGMNCALYQPFDEGRFKAYQQGIEKLIREVHSAGSRLILLTPPPYAMPIPPFPEGTDQAAERALLADANRVANNELARDAMLYGYKAEYPYYDKVLDIYAEWLKTLSDRDNVWVIDMRNAMLPRLKDCYDEDPIHPNDTGHHVMAETFLLSWPVVERDARSMDAGR